jgi:hypothetical protein
MRGIGCHLRFAVFGMVSGNNFMVNVPAPNSGGLAAVTFYQSNPEAFNAAADSLHRRFPPTTTSTTVAALKNHRQRRCETR